MKKKAWILSCEHAGNLLPSPWDQVVKIPRRILESHEGIDIGALELAEALQARLKCPLYVQRSTRLLIELNRSLHHPKLFSRFSQSLEPPQKKALIQNVYLPYRQSVEEKIASLCKKGHPVIHISVHSFTPVWNGKVRETEVGLLYDPKRPGEVELARLWKKILQSSFRTRMNDPYRGTADGFTTHLRKRFSVDQYCGVELEVSQKLLKHQTKQTIQDLENSLAELKRNMT